MYWHQAGPGVFWFAPLMILLFFCVLISIARWGGRHRCWARSGCGPSRGWGHSGYSGPGHHGPYRAADLEQRSGRDEPGRGRGSSAEEVLDERFAHGEIAESEYLDERRPSAPSRNDPAIRASLRRRLGSNAELSGC